ADQRDLELERGLAKALFERRPDRETHGAVEQRCREAAMHGAGWIEMRVIGDERDDDAAALDLGHVIAKRLRDGVEWQCAVDEALHEGQPADCAALFCSDRSVALACHGTSLNRHRREWRAPFDDEVRKWLLEPGGVDLLETAVLHRDV